MYWVGYGYALVAGLVVEWKNRLNEDGLAASQVEPIRDEAIQKEVRRLIREKEPVQQVKFQ